MEECRWHDPLGWWGAVGYSCSVRQNMPSYGPSRLIIAPCFSTPWTKWRTIIAPCLFNTISKNRGSIPFSIHFFTCFHGYLATKMENCGNKTSGQRSPEATTLPSFRPGPRCKARRFGNNRKRAEFCTFLGFDVFWRSHRQGKKWTYLNICEYHWISLNHIFWIFPRSCIWSIILFLNLRQVCWGQLRKLTIYWPMPSATSHWEESGMSLPNPCGTRKRQVAIDTFPTFHLDGESHVTLPNIEHWTLASPCSVQLVYELERLALLRDVQFIPFKSVGWTNWAQLLGRLCLKRSCLKRSKCFAYFRVFGVQPWPFLCHSVCET